MRRKLLVSLALAACSPLEFSRDPVDTAGSAAPDVPAATTDVPEAVSDVPEAPGPEFVPAGPRLFRLSSRQYRNSVRDLFGPHIVPPSALEPDRAVDGLIAVGATVSTLSARGVEQYFDAALALAEQVVASDEARQRVVPCATQDGACAREAVAYAGRLIWRRPLETAELDALMVTFEAAQEALGTWDDGLRYALTFLLQSPHFLYRAEQGDAATSAYAPFELAARLSYFLWNSTPDKALLEAAESGALLDDAVLATEVDRLLADARARDGVRNFFAEWLGLYELDALSKDPNVFRHYSSDLGALAREETLKLAETWAFEEAADFRSLFTTRTTFVNRRLAAIYDIPAPSGDELGAVDLPLTTPRRGILGHVGILALHSHPTSSSATLRGKFIRERVLCGAPLTPPANLNTSIPEPSPDARTLKERLVVHMQVEECGACHRLLDPIGFGLENFDGIGRFRTKDNDAPIDPSGTLDGEPFEDAVELMARIANHPMLTPCFVKHVYSYANGHAPENEEAQILHALHEDFRANTFKILHLFRAVALSRGFREVTPLSEVTQ